MSTIANTRHAPRSRALFVTALTLAVVGALASNDAAASGFQIRENSVKALGRAFAGVDTAGNDASVVVNNPAAMSDLSGMVFQADVTAIGVNTKFHGGGTDLIRQPLTGGNGGNGGDVTPVPALYFSAPINDAWRVGVALTAPFGLKTEYDDGWVGRYQALKSKVTSEDITGSVSWNINPQFALGASIIAQKTTVDLSNAVDFGGAIAGSYLLQCEGAGAPASYCLSTLPVQPQSLDGSARVRGDDWSWGWQLGAEFRPTPQDRIGLNYHAKINHTISGNAYFTVPPMAQALLALGGEGALFQNTAASGDFATPASFSASYWHAGSGPVSWGAQLGWTGWSSFKRLAISYANPAQPATVQTYNWRDTLFGSLGMDYKVNEQWTLRGGVAFDQTPTRDSTRDPRIPDGFRRWLAFGVGYAPSANVEFNLGYVHLFVNNGDVNDTSATGDNLVGSFDNSANLLGLSGTFHF